MIYIVFFVCLIRASLLQAYPEPTQTTTTVQIHNHDGPIYIHPQNDLASTNQSPLLHTSQTPSQNSQTPSQNTQTPCPNSQTPYQNSQATCQNSQTACQNSQTLCQNSQTPYYSTQIPCHNSQIPCQDAPIECTCVTKHQSNCIPINCVPQSQCSGTYYNYPDSTYCPGEALCPRVIGDVVLTYGTQNTCPPQNNCQYGYLCNCQYGYY